ncbi:MAG: FAD-dependent oxidoreductase [Candidatus Kariarchaeaceae archaeon]
MTDNIIITVDGIEINAQVGNSILDEALNSGIYIPHLCSHPDLPPLVDTQGVTQVYQGSKLYQGTPNGKDPEIHTGCRLCVVQVEGEVNLVPACSTIIENGIQIKTKTPEISEYRKQRLAEILAQHPHACLTCAQREGCAREPCSSNVPVEERCCPLLGNCELEKISDYIGIPNYTSKYIPSDGKTINEDPLIYRDYELCISCTRCVHACNDLRGVSILGYTYVNGDRVVGTIDQPNLFDTDCRFCGACVEVCPTGAIQDKGSVFGRLQEDALVPCKSTCPLSADVPQYIRYISKQQYSKALAVILEQTPFPSVLGRVCSHPCELECRRGEINEPVAICALKRFVTDSDDSTTNTQILIQESTGKRVAIIGGGPTGLTAAYFLKRKGHGVEVFERDKEIGGLLRTALPNYRLPEDILRRDLQYIEDIGVQIHTSVEIGKDIEFAELLSNGFSSILVAIGSQVSKKLDIIGSDLKNVHWGIDFLKGVKSGKQHPLGQNVIVIGGGGVAIDVALTSVRMDVENVQLVCLESQSEMPAHDWEIKQALEEGISINCSWGPKEILREEERVVGIKLVKCTSVFDDKGNFSPQFDETVSKNLVGDTIILAIGQTSELEFIDPSIEITPWNTISVDSSMNTSKQGIFAGGEVVSGPISVVQAIEDGKKAAIAMDRYLGGDGDIFISFIEDEILDPHIGRINEFAALSRVKMPQTDIIQRIHNFDEVEIGYNNNMAIKEAERCLQCDLRMQISSNQLPPEKWFKLDKDQIMLVPKVSGVVQLLDKDKGVILIQGTISLRSTLLDLMDDHLDAEFYIYEEDEMYTKRESELLQTFLATHGSFPRGNESDLDDDLF